jgi:hypothetical protein
VIEARDRLIVDATDRMDSQVSVGLSVIKASVNTGHALHLVRVDTEKRTGGMTDGWTQ